MNSPKQQTLDEWLTAVKSGQSIAMAARHISGFPAFAAGRWQGIVTDSDGRFQLTGIGRERQVKFHIRHPNCVTHTVSVVTREMEPVAQPAYDSHLSHKETTYGARFECALAPSRPYEGTIKDAETGKPIAGVEIWSDKFSGQNISGIHTIKIKSDKNGRYRLNGMPKGPGNKIVVVPVDLPYFTAEFDLSDPAGLEPAEMDIELHRGVWVSGRVTNGETGAPVAARMHYMAPPDHPLAAELPEFEYGTHAMRVQDRYRTDADGNYRVVALSGRALIGVNVISAGYPKGQGHKEIADRENRDGYMRFNGVFGPTERSLTAIKELQIPESGNNIACDFVLQAGKSVGVQVTDPVGQPLTGVAVNGSRGISDGYRTMPQAEFEISALRIDETRTVLLKHERRGLGKAMHVAAFGSESKRVNVRLEPFAKVTGRLLKDGAPLPGQMLRFDVWKDGDYGQNLESVSSDEDGRFTHEAVLPGLPYAIHLQGSMVGFEVIAKKLQVHPGETVDLGTVDVASDDRPEPVRTMAVKNQDSNATSSDESVATGQHQHRNTREYEGKVVDPSGHPVKGADLYLVFHIPEPTGLFVPKWKPVFTTDANGIFTFSVSPEDFGIHSTTREFGYGMLVAVKENFGFAWSPAGMYEKSGAWVRETRARLKETPAEYVDQMKRMLARVGEPLQLVMDNEPIRGRIFDIDGQPVSGARLTLLEVWSGSGDDLTAWRKAADEEKADYYSARMKTPVSMNGPQVRSLVQPAVTDADGHFTLRGVGNGRIAELLLEGPGIESAKIFARTEAGEKIELMRERLSPELGSYIYYPSEFTFVAGPSVAITGVVRNAATKTPLSNVTVKSQKRHGEPIHGWGQDFVRAVTDEQGRFRLEGMPIGTDNRIAAIAPLGDVAYFSMSKRAATTGQDHPLEVDFELRSGVWVEGRITDTRTGKGLSGRLAYYVKKENSNYKIARSLGVDQRDRLLSDDDGHFRIAALPGPGFITFMAHEHQIYPRADSILKTDGSLEKVGRKMLETGPSILMPQNYHLVAEVNPNPKDNRVELSLELISGRSLFGRVIGPDDQPVTNYYYTGRMAQFATWRSANGDQFELTGYDPQSPRHVYIAHRDRNLAGHVVVSGEAPENLVLKLQHAGEVTGRVVDEDGSPLANCQLVPWGPPMSSLADSNHGYHAPPLPRNKASSTTGQYETDDEGRFTISCLVPGVEYRLRAFDRTNMSPSRGRIPRFSGPLDVVIRVEPGETKDLGDVGLAEEADFIRAAKENPLFRG